MLKKLKDRLKNSKGFSLIELIVVIAIMVILIALLVPNVIGYINSANDTAKAATASSIYTATAQSIATARSKNITSGYTPFSSNVATEDKTGYDVRFLVSGSVDWTKTTIYFNADLSSVVAVTYDGTVYPSDYADDDDGTPDTTKIENAGGTRSVVGVAKDAGIKEVGGSEATS